MPRLLFCLILVIPASSLGAPEPADTAPKPPEPAAEAAPEAAEPAPGPAEPAPGSAEPAPEAAPDPAGPAPDNAAETASEPAAETATEAASEPVAETATEAATEAASEPAAVPETVPATETATENATTIEAAPDPRSDTAPAIVETAPEVLRAEPEVLNASPEISPPARVEEGVPPAAPEAIIAEEDVYLSPMRGSTLIFRNLFTALSLVPGADPTYNPSYLMSLRASPIYWPHEMVNIWGDLYVAGELTTPDSFTDDLFFVLDSEVGAGLAYTIPVIELDTNLDVGVSFPTTKESQMRTKVVGISAELGAARTFAVLEGLTVGLFLGIEKEFHEYSSGAKVSERGGGCTIEPHPGCSEQGATTYDGSRNINFTISGRLEAALAFYEWLSFGFLAALYEGRLYDVAIDPRNSITPQIPTSTQNLVLWGASLKFTPVKIASVALGMRGFYDQLRPDGSYREPFFNRYTQIYLDLIFNAGELFDLEHALDGIFTQDS